MTEILQVLNSDFGKPNTMGYRAFQIFKNSNLAISVVCRRNFSKYDSNRIKTPFPFYRVYSRFVQLVLQRLKYGKIYRILRAIEIRIYNFFAKRMIDGHDVIHFFFHSLPLVEYAKSKNKTILIEAFTHYSYIEKIHNQGIQLDSEELIPESYSVKSYKLARVIISPSEWVSRSLQEAQLDVSRIVHIPYGVHVQKDRKYEKRLPLRLMFAGGLKRTKGVIELLDAVSQFDRDLVRLDIYGRPYAATEREIKTMSINPDIVCFKGFIKDIVPEYEEHDVYIYPTYFEGSSKTVFEAMSCGLPVITTKNAGSIVRDQIDGFIVPVNDVGCLKERIDFFIENSGAIKQMGKAAQEHSRKYTWERYGKRVGQVYSEILR